jgi:hypothetical protein
MRSRLSSATRWRVSAGRLALLAPTRASAFAHLRSREGHCPAWRREVRLLPDKVRARQGLAFVYKTSWFSVTHEAMVAEHTRRIVRLLDGRLNADEVVRGSKVAADELHRDAPHGLTQTFTARPTVTV